MSVSSETNVARCWGVYLRDATMSYGEAAGFPHDECGFSLDGWKQLATRMLD